MGLCSDLFIFLFRKKFKTICFIRGHLPYHYSLDKKPFFFGYLLGRFHYLIASKNHKVVTMSRQMALEFSSYTSKDSLIINNYCEPIIKNLTQLNKIKTKKYNLKENYTFIFVGNLTSNKNIINTLFAFKKLVEFYPEFKLKIYGNGPLKNEVIKIIKKYNLDSSIKLCNFTKNKINIYSDADFLLHPSLQEGTSRAVMEALLMHIPVIMLPILGVDEIIIDGFNGKIIDKLYDLHKYVPSLIEIFNNMSKKDFPLDYYLPEKYRFENFKKNLDSLINENSL